VLDGYCWSGQIHPESGSEWSAHQIQILLPEEAVPMVGQVLEQRKNLGKIHGYKSFSLWEYVKRMQEASKQLHSFSTPLVSGRLSDAPPFVKARADAAADS
jgi:Zn-dependent oligopeptidase